MDKIKNKNSVMAKLTPEELSSIKEMQTQYNKYVFELGSVEAQLQNNLTNHQLILTEKDNVLNDIKKLGEKEKEIVAELQSKYGAGNIDIETGEITPL
jgi:hypothetical protein